MKNGLLLWVDDEIELLKAHIIFLEKKGYEVHTVSNGVDAIDMCRNRTYDLIFLDEMMPGLTGLETLQKIKEILPSTPVVMVTKSEEENIMDRAIGSKIADYLIKPVNPNQILLTLKKNIHKKEIVSEVTQTNYREEFQNISFKIDDCRTFEDWVEVYKKIVHWELELSSAGSSMHEILEMQKEEANKAFAKYIRKNYVSWISTCETYSGRNRRRNMPRADVERPMLSCDLLAKKVFPLIDEGKKVFMVVIDNFRYDQWRIVAEEFGDKFDINENLYMSILPTVTQYARNSIFSGLMPEDIMNMYPDLWVDEDSEEGKNLNEGPLIQTQIDRYRRHDTFSYNKINDSAGAERFMQQLPNLKDNDLNVLVVNFIDMLSHARTESKMVRELANNESAYRSITLSWFRHTVMSELINYLADTDYTVILTTDHGSIRVQKPVKIIGDKNTNTNLRYKLGKNLSYDSKDVFVIKEPSQVYLPSPNISTSYVFSTGNTFFAYPNNYNYYVSYYKDTFQHGGVSMEEMLIPVVTLTKRKR